MGRKRTRPLQLGPPEELRCPACNGPRWRVGRRQVLPAGGPPVLRFRCADCGEERARSELDGSWFEVKPDA